MKSSTTQENNLDHEERITLNLLDVIEENSTITQRSLALELDVALGLTNSYIKRCAKKGLIKVRQIPSNRYAYYLTPRGFAEKSRLTAEYLKQSFNFFRLARSQSTDLLQFCLKNDWSRIALVGKSDLTEITILSAAEFNIKFAGIIDAKAAKETPLYMNLPIVDNLSAFGLLHAVILTDMEKPQETFDQTVSFFSRTQVLTTPLLGVRRERVNQPASKESIK
jgi:DNA-binding MarR family transcriptional regulator